MTGAPLDALALIAWTYVEAQAREWEVLDRLALLRARDAP